MNCPLCNSSRTVNGECVDCGASNPFGPLSFDDARADLITRIKSLEEQNAKLESELTLERSEVKNLDTCVADWRKTANERLDLLTKSEGRALELIRENAKLREAVKVAKEALRDAQMHIEADNIDWSRFQEGPDHDPNYKPQFPEIVDRCSKSINALNALELEPKEKAE